MARDDSVRDAIEKHGFLGSDFRIKRVEVEGLYQPVPAIHEIDLAQDASVSDVVEDFTTFTDVYASSSDKVVAIIEQIDFVIQVADAWEWDKFGDFGAALTDGIQMSYTIEGTAVDFGPLIKDMSDLLKFYRGDDLTKLHLEDQDATTVLGYVKIPIKLKEPLILIYDATTEDKFTVTIKGGNDNLSTLSDAKVLLHGNDYILRAD